MTPLQKHRPFLPLGLDRSFHREEEGSEFGYEFTQASNGYLLTTSYAPGTMLGAKQGLTDKTDMVSVLVKLRVSEQTQKPVNTASNNYINK